MFRLALSFSLSLSLLWGCGIGDPGTPEPPKPGASDPAGGAGGTATTSASVIQGLDASQRQTFFHTAEGSELYPLLWIRALESSKTHRPFLEEPERFGLIPDPDNELGLAIGLTAHESRGVPFLGKMVGINCAACHVGKMTYKGQERLIVGAPNLFDLNGFYLELFASAKETASDPKGLAAFLARLGKQAGSDMEKSTKALIVMLADLLKAKTEELKGAEQTVAERARSLFDKIKEAAGEKLDLLKSKESRAQLREKLAGKFKGEIDSLVRALQDKEVLEGKLKGLGIDADAVQHSVEDLTVDARLIKARIDFLVKLDKLHHETKPEGGPGRIDAFGSIRDLVLPPSDFIPASSPVSYPHLWQVNQTVWLHWDGNTNTLMQRNVGQSLGLGAVFDPETMSSTVLPRELYELEVLARKIEPPKWPEAMLGSIDKILAKQGEGLYKTHCASCHVSPDEPDVRRREQLHPLEKIGTDPGRARNFAIKVGRNPDGSGGTEFAQALRKVAGEFTQKAFEDNNIPEADREKMDLPPDKIEWRTTGTYVARPLVAPWATAPYLHNGSVPTLWDLLQPASKRPATFPIGHREYDPIRLGYVTDPDLIPENQRGRFPDFDATLAGNHNVGHEYGTDLSDDEKRAIIEYMKSL